MGIQFFKNILSATAKDLKNPLEQINMPDLLEIGKIPVPQEQGNGAV